MSDIEAIRKRDAEISWDRIPSTTDRFAYITYAEDDRHKLLAALDEALEGECMGSQCTFNKLSRQAQAEVERLKEERKDTDYSLWLYQNGWSRNRKLFMKANKRKRLFARTMATLQDREGRAMARLDKAEGVIQDIADEMHSLTGCVGCERARDWCRAHLAALEAEGREEEG